MESFTLSTVFCYPNLTSLTGSPSRRAAHFSLNRTLRIIFLTKIRDFLGRISRVDNRNRIPDVVLTFDDAASPTKVLSIDYGAGGATLTGATDAMVSLTYTTNVDDTTMTVDSVVDNATNVPTVSLVGTNNATADKLIIR